MSTKHLIQTPCGIDPTAVLRHGRCLFLVLIMVTSMMAMGALAAPATGPDPVDSTPETPLSAANDHSPDSPSTAEQSSLAPTPTSVHSETLEEVPDSGDLDEREDTIELTLVTGETIEILETEEDDRIYAGDHADELYKLEAPDGTYVYPHDVDFSVFDPELFNIDLLLEQELSDAESDAVPVIIDAQEIRQYHFDGESFPAPDVGGYERSTSLESIGAEAGEIRKSAASDTLAELFDTYAVESIHLDRQVEVALDTSVEAIGGEQVRDDFDVNGSGVTVAVLDTGVDATHPDIDVVEQKDFTGDGVGDVHGHGTHVAGTVAGNGSASDGEFVGVAPGAGILDVKVLGDDGFGSISTIIEGMEAAVEADADVISMSLGGPEPSDDPYVDAVDNVTDEGVTVVAAGGNEGPAYRTIGTPGAVGDALTVGAYDHEAGEVAPFSSKGPTINEHLVKPDILAPGVGITAPVPGEGYEPASGTSMATPHVSGALALMLEHDDDLTPAEKKDILMTNADAVEGDVYTQGGGHLNLTRAIQPDLIVENATHSLGGVSENETIERTITVENPTNESIELDLTGVLTNVETGTDHSDNLTPAETSVTVEAESAETIDFLVESDLPGGIYSGVVTIEADERAHEYTIPVGFVRGEEITIEKLPLTEGEPTDDGIAVLTDTGPVFSMLDEGEASFFLSEGEYTVWSQGTDEPTERFVMMSKQIDVDGPATYTLDESETAVLDFEDDNLDEDLATLETHASFETEFEIMGDPAIFDFGVILPFEDTIRVSEDDSLDVGVHRLAAPAEQVTDEDGVNMHLNVSDVYLTSQFERGVDEPETFVPEIEELAVEERTYHRTAPEQGQVLHWGMVETGVNQILIGHPLPLGDRVDQTIYTTEETEYASDLLRETGVTLVDRAEHDAEAPQDVDVNRGPLMGYVDVDISSDHVEAWGQFMGDQTDFAHPYTAIGEHNEYLIAVNGTPVTGGGTDGPFFGTDADVDLHENDSVEVVALGSNPEDTLGTEVITEAHVTYSEDGDNTPPQFVALDIPLDENNVISEEVVTVQVVVISSDGLDAEAFEGQIADGDVEAEPAEGDEWDVIDDWNLTNGDDEVYVLETELDLGQYDERPHLALRAEDDGGDAIASLTRNAFALGDVDDPDEPGMEQIVGELTRADGTPAVGDTVIVNRLDVSDGFFYEVDTTDENGSFSVEVSEDGLYDLTYLQWDLDSDPAEAFPHDGNVDVHALATVDLSDGEASAVEDFETAATGDLPEGIAAATHLVQEASSAETIETTDPELGAVDLPAGHVLDVKVTDSDDSPIAGAGVEYMPGPENFSPVPLLLETNEDGYATLLDRDETGLEVNGSVEIPIEPPRTATYAPDVATETVDVDEDTEQTVTLEEREIIEVPDAEATIQEAVDNATADELIVVADGEYSEEVVIEESVAIVSESSLENESGVGAPADTATLQGDGSGVAFEIAPGVETAFIEGFEITNYEIGIGGAGGETGQVTIRDNSIENVEDGVLATAPDDASAHVDWLLERNLVDEPDLAGIALMDVELGLAFDNEIRGDGDVSTASGAEATTDQDVNPAQSGDGGTHSGIVGVAGDGDSEFYFVGNELSGTFNQTGISMFAPGGFLHGGAYDNSLEGQYEWNHIFVGAEDGGGVENAEIVNNDVTGTSVAAIGVETFDEDSWIGHVAIGDNEIEASSTGIGIASSEDGGQVYSAEFVGNQITAGAAGILLVTEEHEFEWIGAYGNTIEGAEIGILAESSVEHDSDESVISVDVIDTHVVENDIGVTAAGDGVSMNIEETSVVGNEDGIRVTDAATLTITGSTIGENAVGINASSGAYVQAPENYIIDNEDFGAHVEGDDAFIDARYNWWGDASGPSGDVEDPENEDAVADGDGDAVTEQVRFYPWIDVDPAIFAYTTEDDTIDTEGLRDAVSDWRSGEIDTDLLRDVVGYWRSGEIVE